MTVTFVAAPTVTYSGGDYLFSVPSGTTRRDDLWVLPIVVQGSGPPAPPTSPSYLYSGFGGSAQVVPQDIIVLYLEVWYWWDDGSGSATVLASSGPNGTQVAAAAIYRGVDKSGPFTNMSGESEQNVSSVAGPSGTCPHNGVLLGCWSNGYYSSPPSLLLPPTSRAVVLSSLQSPSNTIAVGLSEIATPGTYSSIGTATSTFNEMWRVTTLALNPGLGPRTWAPTRQFPRDDTLGIGTARQVGSTSRQASTRQGWRGTYS